MLPGMRRGALCCMSDCFLFHKSPMLHVQPLCFMLDLLRRAGCVCRFLPYVGQATIIMNDYPYVKYGLIAVLALFVLTSKE